MYFVGMRVASKVIGQLPHDLKKALEAYEHVRLWGKRVTFEDEWGTKFSIVRHEKPGAWELKEPEVVECETA